jgi:hypothetical protein
MPIFSTDEVLDFSGDGAGNLENVIASARFTR